MNIYQKEHCAFELAIVGCVDRQPMLSILISDVIFAFIIAAIKLGWLYHRVINKKISIFEYEYFIRPKPIESMLLFGGIYNVVRSVNTLAIIFNVAPGSIMRAVLCDLPWQFGFCSFSCYLFGLAHTICSSNQLIGRSWFKLSIKIDIICTIFIVLPFITNNICSIVAAIYFNQANLRMARIFRLVRSSLWTVYGLTLITWILIAGLRLIKILKKHLSNQKETSNNASLQKIRNGLLRVRMTMSVSVGCFLGFVFIRCLHEVLIACFPQKSEDLNFVFGLLAIYDGTVASALIVLTMHFNPKALAPFSLSASSTQELPESYNDTNTTENITLTENHSQSKNLHHTPT